jgi:hypothetical protein
MRSLFLLPVVCSLAALAACEGPSVKVSRTVNVETGGRLRVVDSLSCPEHQGPLTRIRTAPDGLSCLYSGPRASEVELRLVRVAADGFAESALVSLEAEVAALMPHTAEKARQALEEDARRASDAAEVARAEAEAAATDDAEAAVTAAPAGASTIVRMPGMEIDANEADGSARIRIGPVRIDAREDQGTVAVHSRGEQVDIRALDEGAQIRSRKVGEDLKATYILVDETASPAGWRLAGYEARGPKRGPVVVALVKSRDRQEDSVFDAAKALVRRNVGG